MTSAAWTAKILPATNRNHATGLEQDNDLDFDLDDILRIWPALARLCTAQPGAKKNLTWTSTLMMLNLPISSHFAHSSPPPETELYSG